MRAILAELTPPAREGTPVGAKLVAGAEDAVWAEAKQRAADAQAEWSWRDAVAVKRQLTSGAAFPDPAAPWVRAEQTCPSWHRRQVRREVRRARAWYDCALRLARNTSPAVSSYALAAWRDHQQSSEAWAATRGVRFADGTTVPLADVQRRSREARRSQLYAVIKGMEWYGHQQQYTPFFITLTLPGEYHPFTVGEQAADGSYPHARPNPQWRPEYGPQAQKAELQRRWQLLRARLAKIPELRRYYGVLVPEPHQDGTPHYHALVWLPTYFNRRGSQRLTEHALRRMLRDIAPCRQGRLEVIRQDRPGAASPASYVTKYVLKAMDDSATRATQGEDGERHRAWASTRELRRMRLVGVHGSLRVWQRIWTAAADETMPARARQAWTAMRRSEAAGSRAAGLPAGGPEWLTAREEQAAAAAEALLAIGGLPGADGRLRLGYEDTVTAYGRPTARPVVIIDEEGGPTMRLQRQTAEIVELPKREGEPSGPSKDDQVTLGAIYPRAGATPLPTGGDPAPEGANGLNVDARNLPSDCKHLVAELTQLLADRDGAPQWAAWCAERRGYLSRLCQPPPQAPPTPPRAPRWAFPGGLRPARPLPASAAPVTLAAA